MHYTMQNYESSVMQIQYCSRPHILHSEAMVWLWESQQWQLYSIGTVYCGVAFTIELDK